MVNRADTCHNCTHMDNSQQTRPSRGGGHRKLAKFCWGPSVSGYIEIPCTGIRAKSPMINKSTWELLMTYMAWRVEGAALAVGVNAQRCWTESIKVAALPSVLPCAVLVTQPGDTLLLLKIFKAIL